MRRLSRLFGLATVLLAVFTGAARAQGPRPVKTRARAVAIAKAQLGTLAFEGRRVEVERNADKWTVQLDPGHGAAGRAFASVTIDAKTGQVTNADADIYDVGIVKPAK